VVLTLLAYFSSFYHSGIFMKHNPLSKWWRHFLAAYHYRLLLLLNSLILYTPICLLVLTLLFQMEFDGLKTCFQLLNYLRCLKISYFILFPNLSYIFWEGLTSSVLLGYEECKHFDVNSCFSMVLNIRVNGKNFWK